MGLSKRQWDLLIVAGQILFFLGSLIFAGYALDTQAEIKDYQNELKEKGCIAAYNQSFETNTSSKESSSMFNDFTTDRGT